MRGVERERERVCVWVGGVRMGEGWRTGHICKSCERNDYKTGGARCPSQPSAESARDCPSAMVVSLGSLSGVHGHKGLLH